ncbi:MAG: secretin and TonB N-terminal domain-containing protein [bacterium]|nr:secretin and TonB N-terminal domain-containing protein [bacterium]
MSYSNIKKILSAALILTFATPAVYSVSDTYSSYVSSVAMTLSNDVKLTDSNNTITLSLRDSDVKQVLRMFADKAGMNVVFHSSVDGKVTLDLVKTPINEAFNLVLSVANLNYYRQGNTMIIMSKDTPSNSYYSKQEMMVFPVHYVSAVSIANFLNKNVFSMKKAGMSGGDAATVNSATNELIVFGMPSDAEIVKKVIEQFDREPYSKTFTVNHTTPAEMANMICNLLLPSRGMGKELGSSGNSSADESGEGNSESGEMTGGAADASEGGEGTPLKLGEGIVACTLNTVSSGSVAPFDVQNLSIAYFPQRGTITLMGGSEAQAQMIESFIKSNDVKQPQAYLEVSIIELNENGSKEFQNQWQIAGKHWYARFDGEGMNAGRTHSTPWTSSSTYIFDGGNNWAAMENGALPNGNPYPIVQYDDSGNISDVAVQVPQQILRTVWGQVPSVRVQWMMNYIIQNRKGRVLANPKILITNGQESVIDLTQDYVEKVTSEFLSSAGNGVSSVGTVQREYTIGEDLGIKISLTPFISPEGYVTLNISPKYSTVADQVFAAGATGTSDLVATLLSRRDLNLKNVRIKDGETLVIGGMLQEAETKTVHKIPLLGDLPVIGSIFRSTSTAKSKNELVIMITPNIINDGENVVSDM